MSIRIEFQLDDITLKKGQDILLRIEGHEKAYLLCAYETGALRVLQLEDPRLRGGPCLLEYDPRKDSK